MLLEEGGRFEEAESFFRAALKTAPAPSEDLSRRIQFRLALVLQKRGKRDESAGLLQALLATPIRDQFPPALLEWLGNYQVALREFDKAGAVADRLLEKADSESWRQIAWCLKGKALMGQGKRDEAQQAFERVTGVNVRGSAMADAWLKLGELRLAAGDAAKAKGAFEEAATVAASDDFLAIRVQAYAGIGRALKSQGDQAGAARHFLSVAVLFDDPVLVPECLYEAAAAFSAIGRADDAAKARKELMDRYPDSEWAKKGP